MAKAAAQLAAQLEARSWLHSWQDRQLHKKLRKDRGAIRKGKRFPEAPRKYSSRLSDALASTSQGGTLDRELI